MKFGLFGINIGPLAAPEAAARVARAAEDAGFDSVWTGEHVVLPDPQRPPSPAPPHERFLDGEWVTFRDAESAARAGRQA